MQSPITLLNNCNYGGAYFIWDRLLNTWSDPNTEVKNIHRERVGGAQVTPINQKQETQKNK